MRLFLCGADGRMGNALTECARARGDTVLPFDPRTALPDAAYADVLVDFSHPDATAALLAYAIGNRLPLCIGTTGQDRGQLHAIGHAAERIPIFLAANFSLGIALLKHLLEETLAVFPQAEIEITETHHDRKTDAPSGTALALANAAKRICPARYFRVGREGNGVRDPLEIGIHARRIGQVTGSHEILLETGRETLTLKHDAHDRSAYAVGALLAADLLLSKPPGLYGMQDLLCKTVPPLCDRNREEEP